MAKRKAARRAKPAKPARKAAKKVVKRQAARKARPNARKTAKKKAAKKPAARPKARPRAKPKASAKTPAKAAPARVPRLDRARRTLADGEPHSTPSSLDMNQHGSAARSGRAAIEHSQREHNGMADVTTGDPDVDVEDAYFTGEEAPGGDNPTPDQDIVEDIGKALGVTYNDNEELEGADKVERRDKHRWELDPASSDDFKDRD